MKGIIIRTRTQILIRNISRFKAGKINIKQLLNSVNKKYRVCLKNGLNAPPDTKNPYIKRNNKDFNKYRYELFKQGQNIIKYATPTLFKGEFQT